MEITEVPAGKDLEIDIKLLVESEQISRIQRISRKTHYLVKRRRKEFRVFDLYNYF